MDKQDKIAEKNRGYIYLFVLLVVISLWFGGFISGLKFSGRETVKMKNLADKHLDLFKIAVRWIKEPQKITNYINMHDYSKVGIYGMNYLGDCLEDILRKSGVKVVCGIDNNAEKLYNPYIPIYTIKDDIPAVDVIIVTAISSYQQIKKDLKGKLDRKIDIISLEDILYE